MTEREWDKRLHIHTMYIQGRFYCNSPRCYSTFFGSTSAKLFVLRRLIHISFYIWTVLQLFCGYPVWGRAVVRREGNAGERVRQNRTRMLSCQPKVT